MPKVLAAVSGSGYTVENVVSGNIKFFESYS